MPIPWNAENAAHLLRRAGFGPTPAEVQKAVKLGLDATVDKLLKPAKGSDKVPKSVVGLSAGQAWWLRRMVSTKSPLTEKLTLFWHNHFATGFKKVKNLELMLLQISTLRALGTGKFRDLCLAVARDPAMIYWLDNQTNVKGAPNQNFARELQELFTTGVLDKDGNPIYTELDVEEAARAFTGWQTYGKSFYFNAAKHDFGEKTFKGHTGPFDGADIVNILVVEEATARRLAMKLFSYFGYQVGLDDPLVTTLADRYLTNDTSIAALLAAIFRSEAFYSQAAMRTHVMEPAEYIARTLRLTKAKVSVKAPDIGYWCRYLGQSLLDPPSVFGWDEGLAWASSAGVIGRAAVAERVADARDSHEPVRVKIQTLLGPKWKGIGADETVARLAQALGLDTLAAPTAAALSQYLSTADDGTPAPFEAAPDSLDKKGRGLLALLLASPEFQLS
jgi:uncharacterized protein (DUF1800 family)